MILIHLHLSWQIVYFIFLLFIYLYSILSLLNTLFFNILYSYFVSFLTLVSSHSLALYFESSGVGILRYAFLRALEKSFCLIHKKLI